MGIKWKQQHINNACVPACVAMLLSQHDIQKEDFQIISESKRPYLIEFNKPHNSFTAGVLIQSSKIMNIVPNKYNLELVNNEFNDFNNYLENAKILLKNNIPFLTSLAQGLIPSIGYKQNKSKRGHAVVVYKFENDRFFFLDPDGGINRNEENDFDQVKDFVSYNISEKELQKILEVHNKFVIGFLKEQKNLELNIQNLLIESKLVFEKYSEISREQAASIINKNGNIKYDEFYDYILRIIKPIALDLKNALLTIPNPSKLELNLISKLEELFKNTISIQNLIKENQDVMIRNHLEGLLKQIDEIQIIAVKVVRDEIEKCH